MRSPEILVISQVPPPVHGSSLMTQLLLSTLADLGYRTALVDRRFSRTADEVGRFRVGKILAAGGLLVRLIRAIARRRPAATIFFITTRPFSFLVDLAMSEVLRRRRVPTIHYVHGLGYAELASRSRAWRWMVERLLGAARAVIVVGDGLEGDVNKFFDGPVRVVWNAVRRPDDLPPRDAHSRPRVLFLSNLIPGKGHEHFLQLALAHRGSLGDVQFVLAGAASPEVKADMERQIRAAGAQEVVQYIGPVVGDTKWALLRSCDAFVFPSTYSLETAGMVLLEAAAAHVPIVAFRTGALVRLLEAEEALVAVAPGDVEGLADGVGQVLRGPTAVAERAFEVLEERFTIEAFGAAWAQLLDEVLAPSDA